MRLYSDVPTRRNRQVVGDLLVLAWVWLWWRIGSAVHDQVARLAAPGRTLEDAGRSLEGGLRSAGDAVTRVPVVGDELRTPFDAAGGAARGLADAGVGVQDGVARAAVLAGWGVALWPALLVLLVWTVHRVRGARRAAALRAVASGPAGRDLLALRALLSRPVPELLAAHPDPAAAWRAGDPEVVRALAALEAREIGVALEHAPQVPGTHQQGGGGVSPR